MKLYLLVIVVLLSMGIVYADTITLFVRPKGNDGTINVNQTFAYNFSFAQNRDCSNILFSRVVNVTTDLYGVGVQKFNISSMIGYPRYLCEYRENSLRATHNLSTQLFDRVITSSLNASSAYIDGTVNFNSAVGSTGNFSSSVNVLDLNSSRNIFADLGSVRSHSFNGTYGNYSSVVNVLVLNASDRIHAQRINFTDVMNGVNVILSGQMRADSGNISSMLTVRVVNVTEVLHLYAGSSFTASLLTATNLNNSNMITTNDLNVTDTLITVPLQINLTTVTVRPLNDSTLSPSNTLLILARNDLGGTRGYKIDHTVVSNVSLLNIYNDTGGTVLQYQPSQFFIGSPITFTNGQRIGNYIDGSGDGSLYYNTSSSGTHNFSVGSTGQVFIITSGGVELTGAMTMVGNMVVGGQGNYTGSVNVLDLNSSRNIFADLGSVRSHSFNGTYGNYSSVVNVLVLNASDRIHAQRINFTDVMNGVNVILSGQMRADSGNISSMLTVRVVNVTEVLHLYAGSSFTASLLTATSVNVSNTITGRVINATEKFQARGNVTIGAEPLDSNGNTASINLQINPTNTQGSPFLRFSVADTSSAWTQYMDNENNLEFILSNSTGFTNSTNESKIIRIQIADSEIQFFRALNVSDKITTEQVNVTNNITVGVGGELVLTSNSLFMNPVSNTFNIFNSTSGNGSGTALWTFQNTGFQTSTPIFINGNQNPSSTQFGLSGSRDGNNLMFTAPASGNFNFTQNLQDSLFITTNAATDATYKLMEFSEKNNVGMNVTIRVKNLLGGDTSHAGFEAVAGAGTGGDMYTLYRISGTNIFWRTAYANSYNEEYRITNTTVSNEGVLVRLTQQGRVGIGVNINNTILNSPITFNGVLNLTDGLVSSGSITSSSSLSGTTGNFSGMVNIQSLNISDTLYLGTGSTFSATAINANTANFSSTLTALDLNATRDIYGVRAILTGSITGGSTFNLSGTANVRNLNATDNISISNPTDGTLVLTPFGITMTPTYNTFTIQNTNATTLFNLGTNNLNLNTPLFLSSMNSVSTTQYGIGSGGSSFAFTAPDNADYFWYENGARILDLHGTSGSGGLLNISGALYFDRAQSIDISAHYGITRDATGVGFFKFNAPTGKAFKFDINGVQIINITSVETYITNQLHADDSFNSGTFTPTITNITGAGGLNAFEGQYMRLGNTFTFSGKIDASGSSGGILAQINVSLPIVSNIGAIEDCAGVGSSQTASMTTGWQIYGNESNNAITLTAGAFASTANQSIFYQYTCQII